MKVSEGAIIVEQDFKSTVLRLWRSITVLDEMRQWYFKSIPAFEAAVGFSTQFMVDAGDRSFMHNWEVLEVKEFSRIVYSWNYIGFEGDAMVEFEIDEFALGSRLKLTFSVLSDFTADIPEFKKESCLAGWQYFIHENLKSYLDS